MMRIACGLLAAMTVAFIASWRPADAADRDWCTLAVREQWPQATQSHPAAMAQARHQLFMGIGVLLDAAYKNGGYVKNPSTFPVHHTEFRDDRFIVAFRTRCPRAQLFLGQLLQAYQARLTPQQRAAGPKLTLDDKPVTDEDKPVMVP
ncbi:MAG TPA: hypothetical protein VGG48_14955 [Rhizomicrobium sp.]|jgi:hypothetical protein